MTVPHALPARVADPDPGFDRIRIRTRKKFGYGTELKKVGFSGGFFLEGWIRIRVNSFRIRRPCYVISGLPSWTMIFSIYENLCRYARRSCGNSAIHWVTQKLPQIYTSSHATFPIRIRKITVQICGNFWVTQYINKNKMADLRNFQIW